MSPMEGYQKPYSNIGTWKGVSLRSQQVGEKRFGSLSQRGTKSWPRTKECLTSISSAARGQPGAQERTHRA